MPRNSSRPSSSSSASRACQTLEFFHSFKILTSYSTCTICIPYKRPLFLHTHTFSWDKDDQMQSKMALGHQTILFFPLILCQIFISFVILGVKLAWVCLLEKKSGTLLHVLINIFLQRPLKFYHVEKCRLCLLSCLVKRTRFEKLTISVLFYCSGVPLKETDTGVVG